MATESIVLNVIKSIPLFIQGQVLHLEVINATSFIHHTALQVSVHYLLERCVLIAVHALFVWSLLLIPQMCVIMTIFCYVFWQAYPSLIAKGKCLKMPIPSECIKCFSTAPRVEHLTSLPRRRLGTFLSVSAFNHERVSMSCS